jgi:hypothetical protein
MNYFNTIKIGDKVWSFEYNWGKVIGIIENEEILVDFAQEDLCIIKYDFNGIKINKGTNQTLFWNEIKFEIPNKPKIELVENKYILEPTLNRVDIECNSKAKRLGFGRNDIETAVKAIKLIKNFTRLLALRDQECPDSRGYEPNGEDYYTVYFDFNNKKHTYNINYYYNYNYIDVPLKTKEDAQKICAILNEGRFSL